MAFIRIQKVNGRYYASKVHSFRNEQGKVRQNTLESYGRVDCSFIRRFFRRGPTQADVDRAVRRRRRQVARTRKAAGAAEAQPPDTPSLSSK